MKTKDLLNLKTDGSVLLIVNSLEDMTDDIYAQVGMIGVLKNVYYEYPEDKDTSEDVVVLADIDWEAYKGVNIPLESKNWYIVSSGERNLGTMKEAGMYPKNGIETLYLMSERDSGFELYESETKRALLEAFKEVEGENL